MGNTSLYFNPLTPRLAQTSPFVSLLCLKPKFYFYLLRESTRGLTGSERVKHQSMVCPRGVGSGIPTGFDNYLFPLGWEFDNSIWLECREDCHVSLHGLATHEKINGQWQFQLGIFRGFLEWTF